MAAKEDPQDAAELPRHRLRRPAPWQCRARSRSWRAPCTASRASPEQIFVDQTAHRVSATPCGASPARQGGSTRAQAIARPRVPGDVCASHERHDGLLPFAAARPLPPPLRAPRRLFTGWCRSSSARTAMGAAAIVAHRAVLVVVVGVVAIEQATVRVHRTLSLPRAAPRRFHAPAGSLETAGEGAAKPVDSPLDLELRFVELRTAVWHVSRSAARDMSRGVSRGAHCGRRNGSLSLVAYVPLLRSPASCACPSSPLPPTICLAHPSHDGSGR